MMVMREVEERRVPHISSLDELRERSGGMDPDRMENKSTTPFTEPVPVEINSPPSSMLCFIDSPFSPPHSSSSFLLSSNIQYSYFIFVLMVFYHLDTSLMYFLYSMNHHQHQ